MPTNSKKVLVIGGAGYIGSHMVLALSEAGYEPVVLDNLSTGHLENVLHARFILGEMGDQNLLRQIFSAEPFICVMHFASLIEVAESMQQPGKYYQNNVAATLNLLELVTEYQIPNFIFSSSAAVYGEPLYLPIDEQHPLTPINPYGRSKRMVEEMIQDFAACSAMHYAILRYFNAAGADPQGRIGECHQPESHLIPLILQVAMGERSSLTVYGRDYPTMDGTCIRDYIHVTDICDAHLRAMEKLMHGETKIIANLGTSSGYSVQQVIDAVRQVTGKEITQYDAQRRMGDPAVLTASINLAQHLLNWHPRFVNIEAMIEHAWRYKMQIKRNLPAFKNEECYDT